jgi:ASC-1-like (ASCH) protein
MAKVYVDLIRKGKKTIDDVPERLRDEVRRILEGTLVSQ